MARKRPGDTQPFLDHDTLTQAQQAKHLNVKEESVMNLGHPCPVSRLPENPGGRVADYTNDAGKGMVRGPARSAGVYRRFENPQSGIPNEANLGKWADYSRANSYHGGHGEGVEPRMPDPRDGSGLIGPGAKGDSDGHLAPLPSPSTENWASYTAGGDSGEGRLQKIGKR